jgi:hypothetical protein
MRLVPGIGTMSSPCASTQARARKVYRHIVGMMAKEGTPLPAPVRSAAVPEPGDFLAGRATLLASPAQVGREKRRAPGTQACDPSHRARFRSGIPLSIGRELLDRALSLRLPWADGGENETMATTSSPALTTPCRVRH